MLLLLAQALSPPDATGLHLLNSTSAPPPRLPSAPAARAGAADAVATPQPLLRAPASVPLTAPRLRPLAPSPR